jgi:chromosome segregation ATPase
MTQSFWESEVAEAIEPQQPIAEPAAQPASEQATESDAEPGTLALSTDEFSALEDRILRAVNLVKHERQARAEADERAAAAEAKLREEAPRAEQLQNEVSGLRAEREQVRQRVERLLSQLDALEL